MSGAPRPEGEGLMDAQGRWVPKALIKEADLLRHELVLELAAKMLAEQTRRAAHDRMMHAEVAAFVSLQGERYGATIGGTKGNVTLTSFDGRYRVVRQVADFLVFTEQLNVAKQLVDECLREWSSGTDPKIRALIEHAFQVDRSGRVNTDRVLSLRKLDIQDERWQAAMTAISDSVQVASSRSYVRVYERIDGTDKYRPIGPQAGE